MRFTSKLRCQAAGRLPRVQPLLPGVIRDLALDGSQPGPPSLARLRQGRAEERRGREAVALGGLLGLPTDFEPISYGIYLY